MSAITNALRSYAFAPPARQLNQCNRNTAVDGVAVSAGLMSFECTTVTCETGVLRVIFSQNAEENP